MWKTQQRFEETVQVINQNTPSIASGGIAVISEDTSVNIKMVILPDMQIYREPRKEGQYKYEKLFAHVRSSEMEKADIIPGRTKVVWNGETYKVYTMMDYTSKPKFKIAEIEMRRKLGTD